MSKAYWTDAAIVAVVEHRHDDDIAKRVVETQKPFVLVGSSPESDIVLESDSIPARAFCICCDPLGRLWGALLCHRSPKKTGFRRVDISSAVTISDYQIRFSVERDESGRSANPSDDFQTEHALEATASQKDERTRCLIKWRSGDETQLKRLRPNRPFLLGRQPPSEILADHQSVSAAHGCLIFDGEQLWIADAGSRNKIRTPENGSADVLCRHDNQIFAAGRVQFKVAIPQFVPRAEHEMLLAELATLQEKTESFESTISQLEQERSCLLERLETVRREQETWNEARRQNEELWKTQQIELENQSNELNCRREQFELEKSTFAEVQQHREHLLLERETELKQAVAAWRQEQQATEQRWREIADEIKRHKRSILTEKTELQREAERLVVQRIRTQRELKEREQMLDSREKELNQRQARLEAAQQRLPRDVADPRNDFPSDSISDSTVLAANDFLDILDQAIGSKKNGERFKQRH